VQDESQRDKNRTVTTFLLTLLLWPSSDLRRGKGCVGKTLDQVAFETASAGLNHNEGNSERKVYCSCQNTVK
jgi:hypothetical protein